MLGEFARRGRDELRGEAARKAHALALDVGAGLLAAARAPRVVAELDADLLEHRLGIVLDERQPFLVEHLDERDLSA